MKNSFSKIERLKNKKLIEKLFDEGAYITSFPLKLIYLESTFKDKAQLKAGVSVAKRNFSSAVDRNYIKRLLREAYRLNKNQIFNNMTTQCALMILYIGNDKPSFETINKSMFKLLTELKSRLKS